MAGISRHKINQIGKSALADEFQTSFLRNALELLLIGYENLPTSDRSKWQEEEITGELCREIQEYLDMPDSPGWTRRYSLHEDPPVHSSYRKGKKRRRIDFRIEETHRRPRHKFGVEAKRLRSDSHNVGKYCGQDGMGCFVSGEYSSQQNIGGMLGYVQSGTVDQWESKVGAKIKKDAKTLHVRNGRTWENASGANPINQCHLSEHDRPSLNKPILIYHLMLNFS